MEDKTAWDHYIIEARKKKNPGNRKLEIISVTMNGEPLEKKDIDDKPNFKEVDPPTEKADCIYVGGTEENRCRWVFGKWF